MTIKQISVFVENKPGRLKEITKVLSDNNIDIRALSVADTTDFGIVRLIVNNPDLAEKVLKQADYTVSITKVIGIGIIDKPGGLYEALNLLDAAHISVEYMYAFICRQTDAAYVVLRVENNEKAADILKGNNIMLINEEDFYNL
ncbi:MAG TPA: acetolactate synthase [Ruminococcaceae bacterium]|nr:acetolactate synthase [Oscillospiraceae bacterium]